MRGRQGVQCTQGWETGGGVQQGSATCLQALVSIGPGSTGANQTLTPQICAQGGGPQHCSEDRSPERDSSS